ncbi:E3 ubiquitin-protein ligase HOS1 [Phalaenopsis equestris]|uniref:E3 ubiquitin-protein ligase HOS1 n=1 Tax=Phalaenopsis equestris TaxID=78828 RepID=UPI0009E50C34|nr:E3 ubiquitin-protein ligase HOS1 [Phalaenopsis equestris]
MSSRLRRRRLPKPPRKHRASNCYFGAPLFAAAITIPSSCGSTLEDALEHLASIDLLELCNEAKIERCRATRDLSSCGRFVQDVLNSCGHASLCAECSKRCDVCPICRTSLPVNGNRLRPRLYYECASAGLISKRHADRFQEKDDSKDHFLAIQRLYSLFDVALDNNLVCLICHYVTDVCMDESAVSSDPVMSFLLDEVVVKDWCKQRFKAIIHDLQIAYRLDLKGMKSSMSLFQRSTSQLSGISNVLEVMVSSFKDNLSAQLNDFHFLLSSTLKTKQHLEIMIWCIQHDFLENVQSCFPDYQSWASQTQERKSAAIKQSWPDNSSYLAYCGPRSESALFIEMALSNLEIEESYGDQHDEIDVYCLQDTNSPMIFSSKISESCRNNASGCYPFKYARSAMDVIFLRGASDMVVAKRAIFLYYLFDRHWSLPDSKWRYLVDDFASSFGIGRLPLLESLVFYLLDDHTDKALQEACALLPEIAGPGTHPKIAQVLLERQCPDFALTVLRCTGRDGFSRYDGSKDDVGKIESLDEAVTVLRVRIECGLLTEAFMFQRMYCHNLKEFTSGYKDLSTSNNLKPDSWMRQMEILVIEMCILCMRRNLTDRMIELPWDSTEEKYIHKCLLEHAYQSPRSISGSLLTVFYLQRYRYIEAFQVHHKLLSLEQKCLESLEGGVACEMKSISLWRSALVEKGLYLLPEIQLKQLMNGCTAQNDSSFSQDIKIDMESASKVQLDPVNISTRSRTSASIVLHTDVSNFPSEKASVEAPLKLYDNADNFHIDISKRAPSAVQQRHLTSFGSSQKGSFPLPLNELNTSPLQVSLFGKSFEGNNGSHAIRSYDSVRRAENSRVLSTKITSQDYIDSVDPNYLKDAIDGQPHKRSGKQNHLDGPWNMINFNKSTHVLSSKERGSPTEQLSTKVGSRWRSDESDEDETDQINKHLGGGGSLFPLRGRTRRFRR